MTERSEGSNIPDKPDNAPTESPIETEIVKRRKRLSFVGSYPISEMRLFFNGGSPTTDAVIVPEHMFGAGVRESLLVPAEEELKRIQAILNTNTTGINIEEPTVSRGLQVFLALFNNILVEKQNRPKSQLIKDSLRAEMIISTALLNGGIQHLSREIAKLPEDKRKEYTLLDYADLFLIHLAKENLQREDTSKPRRGRPTRVRPAETSE